MAKQILRVVIGGQGQGLDDITGAFLQDGGNINKLTAPVFDSGQISPLAAGIMADQFTQIDVDVEAGPVFRQSNSITIDDSPPRRGKQDRDGGLFLQALCVFIAFL